MQTLSRERLGQHRGCNTINEEISRANKVTNLRISTVRCSGCSSVTCFDNAASMNRSLETNEKIRIDISEKSRTEF